MNLTLDDLELKEVETFKTPWTFMEALAEVTRLEPIANKHGLHIGITGGVLYKQTSTKDLDLIIYPHQTCKTYNFDGFLKEISSNVIDASDHHEDDEKKVYTCTVNNKRIDFFCLL